MSQAGPPGRAGGGLVTGLLVIVFGLLALAVLASLVRGIAPALPQEMTQATTTPTTQCPSKTSSGIPVFVVRLSRSAYPQTTKHIDDARRLLGKPSILTLDRPGADQRRYEATKNIKRVAGKQPDEYPPAIAKEGGTGADVRLIDATDNQAAGASMGRQLNAPVRQPDGALFCIELTP